MHLLQSQRIETVVNSNFHLCSMRLQSYHPSKSPRLRFQCKGQNSRGMLQLHTPDLLVISLCYLNSDGWVWQSMVSESLRLKGPFLQPHILAIPCAELVGWSQVLQLEQSLRHLFRLKPKSQGMFDLRLCICSIHWIESQYKQRHCVWQHL